jgi:hypothetical protein
VPMKASSEDSFMAIYVTSATRQAPKQHIGRKNVVKYILNFGVMMTFGLAVPLLAVAIICDTAYNLLISLQWLERFIGLCGEHGLVATNLKQEYWNSFRLSNREVTGTVHIVLGYVSIFWSLFAFDWIADVHGSLTGGLTMLIPLVLPTMIGFAVLMRGEHAEIARQETNNIELAVTSNPVILPQTTIDDFNTSNI